MIVEFMTSVGGPDVLFARDALKACIGRPIKIARGDVEYAGKLLDAVVFEDGITARLVIETDVAIPEWMLDD